MGLATARLFLREGAHVLGVARDAERLKAASAELTTLAPERFTALAADLEQPSSAESVRAAVAERWGALDMLVNNAGVMLAHDPEILHEPEGILERSLEINVLSPFRLLRALLPLLEAGVDPRVVNVSSGAGTHQGMTEPGIASYRLSKWALNGLSMLEAKELRGRVHVTSFDPGWLKTDLGGPRAPGVPEDGARGLLASLLLPPDASGGFYKDGQEIPW